jgi:lipopolysaccharide transport system permease protein
VAKEYDQAKGDGLDFVIIERRGAFEFAHLREIWDFRSLLYFMVWRDLKVRYKQTVLGVLWAVLQPLCAMVVFTVFFGRLAGVPSDGIPYPLFSYAGVILWTFFAQAVNQSSSSLVNSSHLVTKVFFPRLIAPVAPIVAALVDLGIAGLLLLVMMHLYGFQIAANVWLAVPMIALAFAAATGVGLWLAALNVRYRDVRYVIPFLLQMWLFMTPVIYPMSMVEPRLNSMGLPAWIIGLNPMAGAVEGFRWAMLGTANLPLSTVVSSAATAVVLVGTGLMFFRAEERAFADVI